MREHSSLKARTGERKKAGTNLQWQIIDLGNGFVKIKNRTDGLVLNGGGGYSGYPVTEWSDVSSTNLQWQIIDQGNGYVKIRNRTDGLFIRGGGINNGYPVKEQTDGTSTYLEWQLIYLP
ncbi:MAG: RICIN domain-containing protein [Spirochaetales bacterium]|nr:RICIN domain-containing protein [Spirochaetales bacterium]